MIKIRIILILLLVPFMIKAQTITTQWKKCYGGSGHDDAYCISKTQDSGFIITGYASSNNYDVTGNKGYTNYWIIKINSSGNLQWQKCFGGHSNDFGYSIQQTKDGGYITVGSILSNDGDITLNHGGYDYWVVKIDSVGNIQWQRSFGGTKDDNAFSILQTSDNGYIIEGYSYSNNNDVTGHHGDTLHSDYWIVKLDTAGNIQWQNSLGGDSTDVAKSIIQTSDRGYIIAGYSKSNNGDVSGNHGLNDIWLVKLDSSGNFIWQKCIGGPGSDVSYEIEQTSDGGLVIAGSSTLNGDDVSGNHGNHDFWIVKLDTGINIQWQKSYGGTSDEVAYSIKQTHDHGYIVAGVTHSTNGDVTGNSGGYDYWITKLDSLGNLEWQKCLGGPNGTFSFATTVVEASINSYVVAGYTSASSGDVVGNHSSGFDDYWIVKLSVTPVVTSISITINNICPGDTAIICASSPDGIIKWWDAPVSGNFIGSSESNANFKVCPVTNKKYFAEAFDGFSISNSRRSIEVIVNSNSTLADSITTSNSNVCLGQTITLTVQGGVLGTNASWKWYTGACGTNYFNIGKIINITPTNNITFYIRAEGTCNTSSCISYNLILGSISTSPDSIVPSSKIICENVIDTLKINGGTLGLSARWFWYTGTCGGNYITTGNSIIQNPAASTIYYVRAEGICNTTNCISSEIIVLTKSLAADSIGRVNKDYNNDSFDTLVISGGYLGSNSHWAWYSDSCGGTFIRYGTQIILNPLNNTNYFVRAEGACNTTCCVSLKIAGSSIYSVNILEGIVIYPNPIVENITIKINCKSALLKIYNLQGQKMREEKLDKFENILSIRNLINGVYVIEIDSNNKVYHFKIIKD